MAQLPKVTDADFVERDGVLQVAAAANRARCIWRETVEKDIGVDGHLEYVTPEGFAPGRLIAIQVKSGPSRFANATEHDIPFLPEEKHRQYWAAYPLPVVLVLHNPQTAETVWVDARHALRVGDEKTIRVPRLNAFDESGVLRALMSDGPLPSGAFDPSEVLVAMAAPDRSAQGLCFLDLFAQGMTDIANALYFSMDVVNQVLDVKSASWDPAAFSIGPEEFRFIDEYVDFLVMHDLARIDYGSWKQAKDARKMVGKFIGSLTEKGRSVRDRIATMDDQLPEDADPYARAIQERFVQMVYNLRGVDEFAIRQARIEVVCTEIKRRAALESET